MRAAIFLFFLFYFVSVSTGYSIPYNELNITLFPSRQGHVGQFETALKNALHQTEKFFERDDVKYGTEFIATGLESLIGPAAIILPMVQDILGKPDDWKKEVADVLSKNDDRVKIETFLSEMKTKTKIFSDLVAKLNESIVELNNNQISPEDKKVILELARNDASIIQFGLLDLTEKLSDGDSPSWTHPELMVRPIFGLATLITLFTPIRDMLFHYVGDHSIISCKMAEILEDYLPSILYWRLRQITNMNEEFVYEVAYYEDDQYFDGDIRCSKTRYMASSSIYDRIQPEAAYWGTHDCFSDYLRAVRSHVEEVFFVAKTEMERTCSPARKNRLRETSGKRNLCTAALKCFFRIAYCINAIVNRIYI